MEEEEKKRKQKAFVNQNNEPGERKKYKIIMKGATVTFIYESSL
jgi:hypothetical protein